MDEINWSYLKNGDEMYLATVPEEGCMVVATDGKGKYESSYYMDFIWWKDCEENNGDYNKVELGWRPEKWYRKSWNKIDGYNTDYKALAITIGRKEKIAKILKDEKI